MANIEGAEGANKASGPAGPEEKVSWKHVDPNEEESRKGLLLSDEIRKFCEKGLLIGTGYEEKHLRPASYTLRVGPDYVDSKGKRGKLSKKAPSFYIEPNSIAYVSTLESLDLPYYVAARFNLRVKWVYRGILLGTGPQVEPGFRGYLSCPLFNLTDRASKITLGDEFATIDFERTSNFCRGKSGNWIKENVRPSKENDKLDEVVCDGTRFLLFKQRFYPALEHLPDWDVVSSLVQLSNEVKTWRNIGIGILIAFFGATLTLLTFQNNLYRELRTQDSRLMDMRQAEIGALSKLSSLEVQVAETRAALGRAELRLKEVEQRAASGSKKPKVISATR